MMVDKMVSIIVPVYNAERYLKTCIKSILRQTYYNLEIIIIDDGSIDQSTYICDHFAKRDQRIRVYHKKNKGVSSARNLGIEQAKGSYITFVDADDFIYKEYVEILVKDMNRFQADIVQCGYIEYFSNGTKLQKTKSKNYRALLDNHFNYCKNMDIGFVRGKLFRKDMIRDIRFNEQISMSEDALFVAHVMKKSKFIFYEKRILYLYRIHLDSSMRRVSETSDFTALKAKKLIFKMQEEGSIAYYSAGIQYLEMCRRAAAELWLLDQSNHERIQRLKNNVIVNRDLIWKANENLMQKMLLILFILRPEGYFRLFYLKKKMDKQRLVRKSK